MLPRTTLLGLLLIVIINGCASLSKEECARANWDAIGYRHRIEDMEQKLGNMQRKIEHLKSASRY